jgi:predicted SprT family Zn-dependent metalloprotease
VEQLGLPLLAAPVRRRRPPSARRPDALARLARWLAVRAGERRRARGLVVVFNPRLRSSAGRVDFHARAIELNPRLLDRHPGELVATLAHELGHLLAGARAGHGGRWRSAMAALGFAAETCHRMDVEGLAARRRVWRWRCPGCGETYQRRHRKAHRFACGRCGARLRLDGSAEAERGTAEGN